MDLGIKGRVALVTAGSRGLGRAVAETLAAEGAHVALCARGEQDLAEAAAATAAAGDGRILAGQVDMAEPGALESFVTEVEHGLGPVDLCLVNAGGPPAGNFLELELDQWEQAYRLTLESAVRTCRRVLPGMMARRYGRIVAVTSMAVRQPVENLTLSNVIRPAVQALVKDLSLAGAPHGVTVNAVEPGIHVTSALERLISRKIEQGAPGREAVLAEWVSEIPAGRTGEPAEFAALVAFLMSSPAGYITGQSVAADGGWIKGTF
ncbi:SDR family oxidoreductase [bacterium]|nr:SDR family oxidoreductase [bacterium]